MQNLGTLSRRLTAYSPNSLTSTNPHRSRPEYAAERAKLLFGQYRKGDANDPDIYVASITAVLTDYCPETVRLVTDPRTGIATYEKFRIWMPNPGELKAACEDIEAPARRERERQASLKRYQTENSMLEDHREGRLTIDQLKAKYGQTWGLGADEEQPQGKKERPFKRYSDDQLRAMYPVT